MRSLRLVAALVLFTTLAGAQGVHPISGRRYAQVMGIGGADWLVRPEREAEEEPTRAVATLGLKKGNTVADIGAGAGYVTIKLAEAVGKDGKVYATDLQPQMLELLKQNMAARKIGNVVPVLGALDSANLPSGEIDLAIMVDVYHEFSEPQKMLRSIRESLKPGGRLVLLEYRKEDPSVPIRPEHKMSVKEVRAELEPEGFVFQKNIGILPRQHILIFGKRAQ